MTGKELKELVKFCRKRRRSIDSVLKDATLKIILEETPVQEFGIDTCGAPLTELEAQKLVLRLWRHVSVCPDCQDLLCDAVERIEEEHMVRVSRMAGLV